MRVIEGWWEWTSSLGESSFCLGIVSLEHDDETLEPLDGAWSKDSLPKLAALAAELGIRVFDSENGRFIE